MELSYWNYAHRTMRIEPLAPERFSDQCDRRAKALLYLVVNQKSTVPYHAHHIPDSVCR